MQGTRDTLMKSKTILKTVVGVVVIGGGLLYFMVQAMQSSWAYYYSVDEFVANRALIKDQPVRIAGRVKEGSVHRDLRELRLTFTLASPTSEVPVQYTGAVPDNFAEGKEVVVAGRLNAAEIFEADTLMTKCESKYKARR